MKRYIYITLSIMYTALNSYAQVSCDNFVVQQIQMDANQENWEVTIFLDADSSVFINYPFIALMVNTTGDTVAQVNLEYFGQFGQTANVFHPTVTTVDNAFEGDIYFVYDEDTCVFNTASLSVDHPQHLAPLIAYPNPATDVLKCNIQAHEVDQWVVFDVHGRCVHQQTRTNEIAVAQWPMGIYVSRIKTSQGLFYHSFQVIH